MKGPLSPVEPLRLPLFFKYFGSCLPGCCGAFFFPVLMIIRHPVFYFFLFCCPVFPRTFPPRRFLTGLRIFSRPLPSSFPFPDQSGSNQTTADHKLAGPLFFSFFLEHPNDWYFFFSLFSLVSLPPCSPLSIVKADRGLLYTVFPFPPALFFHSVTHSVFCSGDS